MLTTLNSIAARIARSTLLRHLLFLVAALLAIWCIGYRFGSFDQVFHITFLKKTVNPALYPGDPFTDLRFYHYSYFWYFFAPFLRMGILEPVMFAVHVLATYLTFWMLWELSITLFNNPLAALVGTLAFIIPHVGSPGFPLIEDSLLPRTFVLPFLLMAMVFYLRKRYWLAFLILGLMCNLHALSVGFVMAMVLLDCLLRGRTVGWKNILLGLALFAAGASPVLFWKTSHTGIDLSLRPELLHVAARGALTTIYYMVTAQPFNLLATLCGAGTLAMFLVGAHAHPSGHDRSVTNFVYAIGIILVVQVITTYWLPVTIILQLQILRAAFYLLIFGYLYFANLLARQLQDGRLKGMNAALQIGTFIIVIAPFVTWLVWALHGWIAKVRWRQVAMAVLVGGGMLGAAVLGRLTALWQPGTHIYAPDTAWVQAQQWAKKNTPVTTHFITPPQIYSQFTPDWRVFSERPTVATLVELEDVPFDPGYLPGWEQRFEAVAPGAIARFDYNSFHNAQYTAQAFYRLQAQDFVRLAQEYRAAYLVVEKPHVYDFPIAYENAGFVIYDLRGR